MIEAELAKPQRAWGIYDREGNLMSVCALPAGLRQEEVDRGEHVVRVHIVQVTDDTWGQLDMLHPRWWT